ncbi:hypothetical protein GC173_13865 [bacterium]|nr:hypothetical protein [bacterium]
MSNGNIPTFGPFVFVERRSLYCHVFIRVFPDYKKNPSLTCVRIARKKRFAVPPCPGLCRAQRLAARPHRGSPVSAYYRLISVISLVPALAAALNLPPEFFYASVDTSSAATLRPTLHAAISGHTRIDYDNGANWPILEAADTNPAESTEIVDFYGNRRLIKVTDRGSQYNREHMWPQSYGFPQSIDNAGELGYYPRTDLHALFLAAASLNSTRNNRWLDYVSSPRTVVQTDLTNGVGGGSTTYPGNHNWYSTSVNAWETWNWRRGEAARAVLYMDLRYEGGTHPVTGNPEPDLILTDNTTLIAATTTSPAYMGVLSSVLQWHQEDPVNSVEFNRMEIVAASQGNRNPFVDYPEFVECLYGGDCSGVPPINPQNVIALPAPSSVTVTWAPRIESDLAGYNVYFGASPTGPFTKSNSSLLTATNHTVSGLTDGVATYLLVRAVDTDSNESHDSAIVSATPGPRTTLVAESFEEAPSPSSYTITGGTGNSGAGDYFDRFVYLSTPSGFNVVTADRNQLYVIAGEDTNGNAILPTDGIHTVTLAPITVTGVTDIQVSLLVAARDASVYDTAALSNGDYLRVFASLDGGSDVLVGQFTRVGTSGSNGKLGVDTNLDGLGDTELPSYTAMNPYSFPISGTGDQLTVKVVTRFEGGSEQFAYDFVEVSGVAPVSSGVSVTGWMMLD